MTDDANPAPGPKWLPSEMRAKLLSHFASKPTSTHPEGWNDLYAENFTPWDQGSPNPALIEALSRTDLFPQPVLLNAKNTFQRRYRALVPGCGRGYDVLLLSAFGYDAYGLEYSPLAVEEAKKVQKRVEGWFEVSGELKKDAPPEAKVYETRDLALGRGKVHWVTGDFFKDEWVKQVEETAVGGFDGTFEVLYDYTFLSALPPTLRPSWALRFTTLLSPPSHHGRLICLEFPTHKPKNSGGPPWALPPTVYEAHLPRPGKEIEYDEAGEIVEESKGPELENGLVRIAHWQPAKTHETGMVEGRVMDWLGVWAKRGGEGTGQ